MLKIVHITFDMRIGGTEMVIRNIIACETRFLKCQYSVLNLP